MSLDGLELTTSRVVAEHATTTPRQPDDLIDKDILCSIASKLVIITPALCYQPQCREGVADKFVIDYSHCRISDIQGLISLILQ